MTYIATFYTHFAAMNFARRLKKSGVPGEMMPVPRQLSSSCGSCVRFTTEQDPASFVCEETEKIVLVQPDSYQLVWAEKETERI